MTKLADTVRARLRANLAAVQERLAEAAAGRKPAATLVCVTKYARTEWAAELVAAGARHLGENHLPAACERFAQLEAQGLSFTRHLLGAQQSRKLRQIPGHFEWLQALDRLDSATKLNAVCAAAGRRLKVLIEVNLGEAHKPGIAPAEALTAAERVAAECPWLDLRGLMAVPPGPAAYASASDWERGTRGHFETLRQLFDRMAASGGRPGRWDTLSMGMSADYVWALEAGATMVRVGSALFKGLEG